MIVQSSFVQNQSFYIALFGNLKIHSNKETILFKVSTKVNSETGKLIWVFENKNKTFIMFVCSDVECSITIKSDNHNRIMMNRALCFWRKGNIDKEHQKLIQSIHKEKLIFFVRITKQERSHRIIREMLFQWNSRDFVQSDFIKRRRTWASAFYIGNIFTSRNNWNKRKNLKIQNLIKKSWNF